jgi:tRNA threonylcarbamoyladenosine biosynthesis protein TsaE
MATHISHSPAETAALGEAWGREAQSGLVIGLCGDLGAGKTQLVKGLARGLGIQARVHSPTFTLVNIYTGGRLTLFHLDLYRLETREQIEAAGLDDYLSPEGVSVIEWAERWSEVQSLKSKVQSPRTEVSSSKFQVSSSEPGVMMGDLGVEEPLHAPRAKHHALPHTSRLTHHASLLRWVQIEVLSETERRITYEDSGA